MAPLRYNYVFSSLVLWFVIHLNNIPSTWIHWSRHSMIVIPMSSRKINLSLIACRICVISVITYKFLPIVIIQLFLYVPLKFSELIFALDYLFIFLTISTFNIDVHYIYTTKNSMIYLFYSYHLSIYFPLGVGGQDVHTRRIDIKYCQRLMGMSG